MGCANSKQKRCRNCNAPYSPVPRSYSMHVHHPPQDEGDSYHVVALTSTTLGTLKLNSPALNGKVRASESFRFPNGKKLIHNNHELEETDDKKIEVQKEEFSMGLIEAKTWSNMIDQKLPKIVAPVTPTRTPPGEPETIINTWELMEGLEDTTSPFRSPNRLRSFSFDVNTNGNCCDGDSDPKPLWLHMSEKEAGLIMSPAVSEFDPEVISSFRKSLMQLSPDSPLHLKPTPCVDEEKQQGTNKKGFFSLFEEKNSKGDDVGVVGKMEKVVLYSTSLRGVRKTYEDCCQVRLILKGLGVRIDERDVSMHSGFKEELRELLGSDNSNYGSNGRGLLPKVFVGRKCIGGAEEIQKLHEDGKLEKVLDCCEKIEDSSNDCCEACGDIRFVPCETCYGSCKIYYEVDDDDEEEEEQVGGDKEYDDVGEYGFQRCPDCNENGLIRCPICCY